MGQGQRTDKAKRESTQRYTYATLAKVMRDLGLPKDALEHVRTPPIALRAVVHYALAKVIEAYERGAAGDDSESDAPRLGTTPMVKLVRDLIDASVKVEKMIDRLGPEKSGASIDKPKGVRIEYLPVTSREQAKAILEAERGKRSA